jgi:hypothetical protein
MGLPIKENQNPMGVWVEFNERYLGIAEMKQKKNSRANTVTILNQFE